MGVGVVLVGVVVVVVGVVAVVVGVVAVVVAAVSVGGSTPTAASVDPAVVVVVPVVDVGVTESGVPVESLVTGAPVMAPASAATTGDDAYCPVPPVLPIEDVLFGGTNEYDSRTTGSRRFPACARAADAEGAVYGLTFASVGGACSFGGVSVGNHATGTAMDGIEDVGLGRRSASTVGAT